MKKNSKTKIVRFMEIKSIEDDISATKLKIKFHKARIDELNKLQKNIDVPKRIKQIEAEFKKSNILNQLSLNSEYQSLVRQNTNKRKRVNQTSITEQIAKWNHAIDRLQKKLIALREKRKNVPVLIEKYKAQDSKSKVILEKKQNNKNSTKGLNKTTPNPIKYSPRPTNPNFTSPESSCAKPIKISWDLVSFGESSLIIYYEGSNYTKYLPDCKKYFNEIKSIYKFRNAPELEVKLLNGKILEIKNEEVLFFYIKLLPDCFTIFNQKSAPTSVSKWKTYTKSYYRDKLRFLWINKSLEYLCELSDANTPIVPAPELIRNRNGKEEMNNSFIFPIRNQNGNTYLFWESIEENKATYVFNGEDKFEVNVQKLYDFIVCDIVNKRESLIESKELQKVLKFKRRIYHTNYAAWKADTKSALGIL